MQLFEALTAHAQDCPSTLALLDETGGISWEELEEQVDRVALGLVHAGMRRSRPVLLLSPHSRAQALALLAVIRGGGLAMPLPGGLDLETQIRIVETTRPLILVYHPLLRERAGQIAAAYEFRSIVCLGNPAVDEIALEDLEQTDVAGARFPVLSENAPALLNWGLAPQGTPLAGQITLTGLWAGAGNDTRGLRIRDGWRTLTLRPDGLDAHESLLRALRSAGTAVYCRQYEVEAALNHLRRYHVDAFSAPASFYHELCDRLRAHPEPDLPRPKLLEARGHVSPALRAAVRELLQAELVQTVSYPETAGTALLQKPTGPGETPGPLLPGPEYEARILNASGMEILGDAVGELSLQGKAIAVQNQSPGLPRQEALDADGWWRSGLLARRNQGGAQLLGNRFDVVFREGRRVYLRLVADVLEELPGVREAEVVLQPQGAGQFELLALVRTVSGNPPDELALLRELNLRLEAADLPAEIRGVTNFPRRLDGGIDRAALTKDLA